MFVILATSIVLLRGRHVELIKLEIENIGLRQQAAREAVSAS